jgi:Acyltransferase family
MQAVAFELESGSAPPYPAGRRDLRVDLLRALGLICIVLAHANPPEALFELRNFDVPMMAFVSGISYSLSRGRDEPFSGFLLKRFKRLVLPTWIFLSWFFGSIWISDPQSFPFSRGEVRSAYLLGNGFNYVWIIRVFLVLAVTAPVWRWLHRRISRGLYFAVGLALLGTSDAVYLVFRYTSVPILVSNAFGLASANAGFIGLFGIGYAITRATPKQRGALIVLLGAFFFVLFSGFWHLHHKMPSIQAFKYPPRLLYFAYGGAISLVAWELAARAQKWLWSIQPAIAYLSENSLWIYLWHIQILYLVPVGSANWAARYAVVLGAACALVAVQRLVVDTLTDQYPSAAKDLKLILRG